jgi:hypothetical protein
MPTLDGNERRTLPVPVQANLALPPVGCIRPVLVTEHRCPKCCPPPVQHHHHHGKCDSCGHTHHDGCGCG